MSELRIKLIELAIQGGATIENATKVAADWEQWATADDDPLRLGEPEPKWQHVSEISESDYQRIHTDLHGIDWLRPQLVTNGHGLVLKTTGLHGPSNIVHGEPWFDAEVVNSYWNHWRCGDRSSEWKQRDFKYHGEIPEEPKNPGNPKEEAAATRRIYVYPDGEEKNTVFVARLKTPELFDTYNNGKKGTWYVEDYVKTLDVKPFLLPNFFVDGENSEGQSVEERTTGLTFMEAIAACNAGETIARVSWGEGRCMYQSNAGLRWEVGYGATLRMEDFLATDWQIIEP